MSDTHGSGAAQPGHKASRSVDLIELCTRRPVAIAMLTVAVLLFGFVSLSRLEVTLLPNLSYPTLTVRTELPGAAPTEIETLLSKPIEEAVGVIKNVRQVRSVSQAGRSDVTIEFNWGTKMDFAVLDVREKLDALVLPKEAVRPIVLRFDPTQDPIIRFGLSIKGAEGKPAVENDLKRLRRIAEQQVQKMLEGVPGVAAVKISGGLEDQVQVLADLSKLSQLNLTMEQVGARLGAENANISGGRVDEGTLSYLVRTLNQFKSLQEISDTVVTTRDGRAIYVRDIAEVRSGFKEREAIIRIDGQEAVEVDLYKEGDGNAVSVAKAGLARADYVRKALPPDLTLTTLYDQSVFIQQAINEVMWAGIIGGLLAILVLYLFLRNAWITAVVGVAIPISVIATFNVMYGSHVTLNIMSLGGIALAIGLLVDDAIVVLENITRKKEEGLPLRQAVVVGAREVVAAVTASTLTTVAVFFPMVFVQGIAGQLFADQALVVTGSLIFSLIVSFTVTPMLVARGDASRPIVPATLPQTRAERFGAPPQVPRQLPTFAPAVKPLMQAGRGVAFGLGWARYGVFEVAIPFLARMIGIVFGAVAWALGFVLRPAAAAWQRGYQRVEQRYVPILEWSLGHRGTVLAAAAGLFALALLLTTRIGVELLPPFNQGEFRAEVTLSPGTPLERTDEQLVKLSALMHGNPAVAANYSVAGTGNRLDASAETGGESFGVLNLELKPDSYKKEGELMNLLRKPLDVLPGMTYRFTRPTLFTLKTPLEIEVSGYDLDGISRVSEQLRARMLGSGRYTEVESTLKPGHPELQVVFDQERAAALNLNTADLATRVAHAVQGSVATRYRLEDREIDVLVRATENDRHSVEAIRNLVINPDAAHPVTLAAVADVAQRSGPSEIRRADQQRVVTLSANLVYGDLGDAVADLQNLIRHTPLPPGIVAEVAGQSEEMKVSFRSLQFALALAVFLVYLVMASEFESLVHPFVILFTIPLAGIGAILALYVTNSVINVIALIGMIMLAGIVVKNGIVLIDLVNRLRDEGMDRHAALLEGCRHRLRPILMTSLTAILGLLPMAIGAGEGAEVRAPMAITVIGGLAVSTILTLVVIPVVYTLLDRGKEPSAQAIPAGDPVAQK
jgi:HAE1 family hydrophobic/amphiphilic exporter-1